jgi:hypothetical protein
MVAIADSGNAAGPTVTAIASAGPSGAIATHGAPGGHEDGCGFASAPTVNVSPAGTPGPNVNVNVPPVYPCVDTVAPGAIGLVTGGGGVGGERGVELPPPPHATSTGDARKHAIKPKGERTRRGRIVVSMTHRRAAR